MKDFKSLHQKVQDHIACFTTTDPLQEMARIENESTETYDSAAKWIALAVIHGINQNADKITISQDQDDAINVTTKYRKTDLPSPGKAVGEQIMTAVRQITHAEGDKAQSILAVGMGNDSLSLNIKLKKENGKDKITFKFPE